MKRVEIAYRSYQKELEKLNARLERQTAQYEKKLAVAKSFNVDQWTSEDRHAWAATVETTPSGFFVNKADEKKNAAWWDLVCAESEIKDTTRSIERAEKRLHAAELKVQEYYRTVEETATLQEKEKFRRVTFEQEQKEWAKDGITLEGRYYGTTPQGKTFAIFGNEGWTDRSLHCFMLKVDGNVIFTSGEFWRAYAEVKRR